MPAVRGDRQDGLGALGRVSIVVFAVGIMTVAAVIAVWRVTQDRRVTLAAAREELITFATALGTQIEAMVGDGTGAATAGAITIRNAPTADRGALLTTMLTGGDYVLALFVFDGERMIVANRPAEHFSVGEMPGPAQLRDQGQGYWFGEIRDHAEGTFILPVARHIGTPGENHWAGALLRISDLHPVYEQLERRNTSVALVTLEGFAPIQLPVTRESLRNIDIRDTPVFRNYLALEPTRVATIDGPHPVTGQQRMFAAYRMQGLPAISTSGRDIVDALAGWRQRTYALVLFLAVWITVVLALATGLQFLYNRRWAHLRTLATAQEEVAEARRAELGARRSLTRELLVGQERERHRVARELHDGIGQNLSMLRNRVAQLKRLDLDAEAREHTESLLDLASETIEDLRDVAHNLKPMHLEELGLTTAFKALVERFEMSHPELEVHSRIEAVDDVLQGEAAVHAYRIVQEAINNTSRHAGARNLWVEVIRDIDHVLLRIRDDGQGMQQASAADRRGLGLTSISERCAILGATVSIESNQPSGASLVIRIFIRNAGAEGDESIAGDGDG